MNSRRIAVVLTGGGARAAYQVGFLRCLGRQMPEFFPKVVTGISAGALNAAWVGAHHGTLWEAADSLTALWMGLKPESIYRTDARSLTQQVLSWGMRLLAGGSYKPRRVRSLVDTGPLYRFLEETLGSGTISGIQDNIGKGRLDAIAVSALNYGTGRTVTWVQGADIPTWERTNRIARRTELEVEHIMASAAIPLFFPAVEVDGGWYGDGGVRLANPLSPAVHLGAQAIIAISTRYPRSAKEAEQSAIVAYPPPAQVFGALMNAIFLDNLDQDALVLERTNALLEHVETEDAENLRPIKLVMLRPSQDLGRLAAEFEPRLPPSLRFLTRGFGTRETSSPDLLSLILFQPDYIARLIELGEADATARIDEIAELIGT